jgi:pimeloyl-ACP methyl ester carboxylesterase
MRETVWKSAGGQAEVLASYESLLRGWQGGVRRRFVDSSLGRIAVLESGRESGNPVVLLHGSMSNSLTWMGDAPRWGRHRRILAVDLPGEPGFSEARRPRLASGEAEAWLAELLDGLGLDQASFVGMSLGGWFALRFATRHADRVSALACIVPGGLAPQRKDFLPKALWYSLQGRAGAAKLDRLVCHKAVMPAEAKEFGALVRRHFKPLTEILPVFADGELKGLTMPLYYAAGEFDALLDTAASAARLRRLKPDAIIRVLSDTGHLVLDRGPEIDAFLP